MTGIAISDDLVNFTSIVIEAGTPPILIPKTGDLFHLYAAGTTGWNSNPTTGNYTAGYLIMDKDNPGIIIQKSKEYIHIKLEKVHRIQHKIITQYLRVQLLIYQIHLQMILIFGIISEYGLEHWMQMLGLLSYASKRTEVV